jgi:hypothetical protein
METGRTLTEEDHFARDADFLTGEVRDTGQGWHLCDENGSGITSSRISAVLALERRRPRRRSNGPRGRAARRALDKKR